MRPTLSLSLSLTRARVHVAYTTPVRRARARAHNSPRALARRPVLLAPRRNREPRTSPNYDTVRSATIHGRVLFQGRGTTREERGPIEESRMGWNKKGGRRKKDGVRHVGERGGKGVESGGKRRGEGAYSDRYIPRPPPPPPPLDPPPTRINAYLSQAASSPGGTSGRKERVIGTST